MQGQWRTGGVLVLGLALGVGCPSDPEPRPAKPVAARAPGTQAPAAPAFVAAPFPADPASLLGRPWKPAVASDALAALTLLEEGVARVSLRLPGETELTTALGRWSTTAEGGLLVSLSVGTITQIQELRFGHLEGAPRLSWSGRTDRFHDAEGKGEKLLHPAGELLFELAAEKPEAGAAP